MGTISIQAMAARARGIIAQTTSGHVTWSDGVLHTREGVFKWEAVLPSGNKATLSGRPDKWSEPPSGKPLNYELELGHDRVDQSADPEMYASTLNPVLAELREAIGVQEAQRAAELNDELNLEGIRTPGSGSEGLSQ